MKLKTFLQEYQFSFSVEQVKLLWEDINETCFDSELKLPKLEIVEQDVINKFKSEKDPEDADILGYCGEKNGEIFLMFSKEIESASELMETVAHEMVHQDLAEKYGYLRMLQIGHKAAFMDYKPIIKLYHNVVLKGPTIN
jgi:hypothetical protein